jgi:hypothetical protein
MKGESRINARLSQSSSALLAAIRKATGDPVSEVIREAIRVYHEKLFSEKAPDLGLLEQCGFVACGAAAEELSTNYKDYLGEELEEKHGNR